MSLDVKASGTTATSAGGSPFPSEWEINRSTTWRDRSPRRRRRLPVAATLLVLTALAGGLLAGVEPLVGAAVLVVVPIVVVVVRRPDAVTVAVIALVYANAPVILTRHGGNPLIGSLVPMALLIPLVHRLLLKGEPLTLPRVFPLLLLFGATQLSSALAADDLTASLLDVSGFLIEGLALFVLVAGNIASTLVLRRVLWAVVLSGAFLGMLSLVQQLTGTLSFDYFGFAQVSNSVIETTGSVGVTTNANGNVGLARLAGPIGEKNRYAQILVVLVPITLGLIPGARTRAKLVLAACIAFQSAGMVLTYSRGAVVGLLVAIALAGALRLVPRRAILALLVAASLALAVLPTYRERVVSLTQVATGGQAVDGQAADGSIAGRMTENLAALLAFPGEPRLRGGAGGVPGEVRLLRPACRRSTAPRGPRGAQPLPRHGGRARRPGPAGAPGHPRDAPRGPVADPPARTRGPRVGDGRRLGRCQGPRPAGGGAARRARHVHGDAPVPPPVLRALLLAARGPVRGRGAAAARPAAGAADAGRVRPAVSRR